MTNGRLRKGIRFVLLWVLCALLTAGPALSGAPFLLSEKPVGHEAGILSYLTESSETESVQAWLDSEADVLFKKPAEWYFLALYQTGGYDFTHFASVYRERVPKEEDKTARSTWLNRMLTAYVLGMDISDEAVTAHIEEGDIMSLVYGLHLSTNTGTSYVDPLTLCNKQCADGGFSLRGDVGDVDVTAMVLEALTPYVLTPAVSETVSKAVTYLSVAQLINGGFVSYGADNCESVSQVIIALSGLGIDVMTDPRFQKEGGNPVTTLDRFRADNGAFCHKEGSEPADITSAELLCAFAALRRMQCGQPPLYVFERSFLWKDAAEDIPTTVPTAAPTRAPGEDSTAPERKQKSSAGIASYKFYVGAGVLFLLLIVLLILKLNKRLTKKNLLLSVLVAAALILITFFTRFETVSEHYKGTGPGEVIGTVTLTIRCDTIAGEPGAPADPVILSETQVEIADGDTAFDVISAATRERRIPMDFTGSGGSVYIKGIAGLYEFAYGNLSGWIYSVNGEIMAVGCGQAVVKPGDRIEFRYTRNLGEDLK